jgi:hypothetical protein
MNIPGMLFPAIAIVAYAQDVDQALKLEFDDLAAQAGALVETVNAMEQRAKDMGESLHPDLVERRALVQTSIDVAAEALRAKNMPALRERLTRARGHIERLKKMI